jgi:membrane-associated phospholipid phosphatase
LGTLLSYALFPYFPSDPPRTVFAGSDLPIVMTVLRRFNLWIVGGYGIHSSVFPSAHVSSAFSGAWALLLFLPERRRFGWGMLLYAISVAIATVYGRYHYAADAVAGLEISLVALAAMILLARLLGLRGLLSWP